ncbi:hypothetical protein DRJ24_04255 [Candidatus Acetothermia bacterium]|nr:MAG: hypothetical protein DRJ24_04255 [Candidatus Acetothermia bacterium]
MIRTGLLLAVALGATALPADSGAISGSWDAGLTFNVQSASVTALDTRFTTVYRVGLFTAKGIAFLKFDRGALAFDSLELDCSFPIEGIEIESDLMFDPNAGSLIDLFDYWRATSAFDLLGVSFIHTLYLTLPQTASYQALVTQGKFGSIDFRGSVRFVMSNDCSFSFSEADLTLSASVCGLPVTGTIAFDCSGFDFLEFTLSDLPVPRLTAGGYGVFLDFDLKFELTEKALNPTIELKLPPIDCIRLYAELEAVPGPGIGGIGFYGIRIEDTIGHGIDFVSAISLDPLRNSVLTGQSDYFELFSLSGPLSSCCGDPGEWRLATYFQSNHTTLFDWGMTTFRFTTALSPGFSFSFETVVRSGTFGDPIVEFTIGWIARW